jgi:hypothetical protein
MKTWADYAPYLARAGEIPAVGKKSRKSPLNRKWRRF